ncbi:MAG TPA: serine/threonine-protein kinase, partial [Dokdonella sp.]|nr:serine/threonine-protein kinase [Dokdonella sp.]
MTDAERWTRISAWFDELVELAPAARALRLEGIEAAEPAAARELRALLEADAREHGLLDDDAAGALAGLMSAELAAPLPADGRIGAYRVLRPIGEGGMGTVYLAERADGAFEQRVAIKLIKRGMDSAAVLQRFLRERRILARLAHAHIVRLLDGGVGADGRPYFVMEYVDGETLERYASARRLPLRERVALVARIAEAVAYAHALLVVHRDLKPSNVIVDANGAPRVLDFGIAKLLEAGDDPVATGTGQQVLSPAYAAPEQILGEAVGTASDVYALGLVLCELLVGELPRRRGTTPAQRAWDAANEEAERPSVLAARLSPARVETLYCNAMSARRLSRALTGDLDVIVATALRREPARRYPTAAAFAEDLRRWLDGRAIDARADSRGYRLARFVRRHRVGVAASALVVVSLFAGLGSALWQAQRAREQAARAEAERANAERQLARTDRVKDYVLALFREQDPISRARAQARTPTELIRSGVAQVDTRFA